MKVLAYTWTNIIMSLDTNDYFLKQISHLSKGVVIVASALCQFNKKAFLFVFLFMN